jgi:branched-chain amino acid aminotransferase
VKHFLNGKIVGNKELLISINDLGFTRGYAVFDFLRTYKGVPFKLDEHIARLENSAKLIGLNTDWNSDYIKHLVLETLRQNNDHLEKTIKIILSGGVTNYGLKPSGKPTTVIEIAPLPKHPSAWYKTGASMASVLFTRYLPEAKTNNYIEGIKQSQNKSEDFILYYSKRQVYEAVTSNIFAVINKELVTPKNNVLKGITRNVILEDFKLKVPIIEKNFTLEELKKSNEIFITSSSIEIVPITALDGRKVGDGKVGQLTKNVMRMFKDYALRI